MNMTVSNVRVFKIFPNLFFQPSYNIAADVSFILVIFYLLADVVAWSHQKQITGLMPINVIPRVICKPVDYTFDLVCLFS